MTEDGKIVVRGPGNGRNLKYPMGVVEDTLRPTGVLRSARPRIGGELLIVVVSGQRRPDELEGALTSCSRHVQLTAVSLPSLIVASHNSWHRNLTNLAWEHEDTVLRWPLCTSRTFKLSLYVSGQRARVKRDWPTF